MRTHSAQLLVVHRHILWKVTRNDLRARYAGSLLGSAWAVVSPAMLLAVYAVIYLFVFRVQVPGLSPTQYVLYIFAGLVPYLATGEALMLGVGSVVANRSVLSNTVFPIDLVPAKAVLTSYATMLAGLAVVILGGLATGHLALTALLVPALVVLHGLALVGLVWMLSFVNVIIRDLQNLVGLAMTVLLIASPIAYTPEMVPASLRLLLQLNPFAYLVIAYQKLLVLGQLPDLGHAAFLVVGCCGLFVVGGSVFSRAKRMMIDYV